MNTRQIIRTLVASLALAAITKADIGPPIGFKNLAKDVVATMGEPYQGEIAIRVHRDGELSRFKLAGEGWEIISSNLPTKPVQAKAGTLRIKFTAIPTDPDAPLALSVRHNRRLASRLFEVGPTRAELKSQQQLLIGEPGSTGLRRDQAAPADTPQEFVLKSAGGAVPIQIVGRIVYDRPGMDNSNPPDGDVDDPGDVPPAVVGADNMRVQLWDQDTFNKEGIWSGYTDENGYFDSGTIWWDDCDITGCDVPDYVLRIAAFSDNTVAVQNTDEDIYEGFLPERLNSTETFIDYGVLRFTGGSEPIIHLLNTVVKGKRFTEEEIGMPADGVFVTWPDNSRDSKGAWYVKEEVSIHISTEREWRTDTILHEYGHHHNNHFYGSQRPDPDYCDPEMDCDSDPANDVCGHCIWCDENPVDAWFEGWANWFADVITRHYPERYTNEDGTPFLPLFTRSQENPRPCNSTYDDPITTEGFVGALLRDIEDSTQDDHDDDPDPDPANVIRDGVFDSLCTGAGKIVFLTYAYDPMNVTEFLAGYLDAFEEETHLLWPTAFNVGGSDYISMFPADAQPPGVVTNLDSPSHPLGQGGSIACMTFAFDPPDDDVKGSNFYSYVVTDDPNGVEPDEGADQINPGSDCKIEFTVPIYELGEYYVSIKAQDNDGNWSTQWDTFGPFEVLDCNNTGQLDICDIDCRVTSIPGLCNFGISPCGSVFSCTESAQDCNGNWEPDICDVTSLRSEDCDINGVPDECQAMKHYTGEKGHPDQNKWGEPENWEEESIPVHWDYVCIPNESEGNAVIYRQDDTIVSSLASYKDFILNGLQSPWPDLELEHNSFVIGDFQMSGGNAKLAINNRLYVDGKFFWSGGTIEGNGLMDVRSDLSLTPSSVNLHSADFLLRNGNVNTSTMINMRYGATFEIDLNTNYNYSGNHYLFYGGNGRVIVDGTLTRESGNATATFFTPLDNNGTVHNKTGELYLAYPGTHTGAFMSDAGTTLYFAAGNGVQDFLPASSLSTPTLKLGGGTGNIHGTVNISDIIQGRGGTWVFHDDANIVDYSPEVHVDKGRVEFHSPTDRAIDFDTVTITNNGQQAGDIHFETGMPFNVGTFTLNSGGMDGSSPINVSGTFTWRNGSIQGSAPINANGPVVINSTSSSRTLYRVLNINDSANVYSGFGLGGNAAINIFNGVPFNMQFNSGAIGSRTINNFGTMIRSSGTGSIGISAALTNSGLVHNQTGTLSLNGGGTHTGDIQSEPGTILRLGGTTELAPGSSLAAETLELIGGTGTIRGTVNVTDALNVLGHTWTFTDEANIISYSPHLYVSQGTVHFEGPTNAPTAFDTVTLGPSGQGGALTYFDTGQPVNINTLTMNGSAGLYGASPINVADQFTWSWGSLHAGGRIRTDGNTTVNSTSSSRTLYRPWNNYGTVVFNGGFGLSGAGAITNMPNATLDLRLNNRGFGLGGILYNDGIMLKTTTDGFTGLPNLINRGTLDIQQGSIYFHTSYVEFHQTAGETILNDTGIEMFLDNDPVHLEGGVFKGNGYVLGDVDNTGGTVQPGFSVGEIEVEDYTQSANGVLEIEIEGTNAGEYDVLTVTGTATLGGELVVTDIAPFVPQAGQSFVILTANSITGTFDIESVPTHYQVVYNTDNVTLELYAVSPDLNADGTFDVADFAEFQACFAGPGNPPAPSCDPAVNADLDDDGDVDHDDYALLSEAIDQ